jgi:esterase/lipase superfamily enzyme
VTYRSAAFVGVLASLLLGGPDQRSLAQGQADVLLKVGAGARARSAAFDLPATTQLTATLAEFPSRPDGAVRLYVFDESGVLTGLDDPEVSSDTFAFQPPAAGRYFVIVLNSNSSPITVRFQTAEIRGRPPSRRNFATVRVLFATNRQRVAGETVQFGGDPVDELAYGYCDVSIPRDHRMGELEAPTIWRLQFRDDPEKHVTILTTRPETGAEFYRAVADRVSRSMDRQALVFIHGFHQTFEDAAKRTAQIAYDVAFDGPAIAFSWPSQGGLLDYLKDQRNADLSARALETLLLRLRGTSRQITVHVIAHSMGNRVLARALEQIGGAVQRGTERPLREVAMMAPDIDAALFRQAAGKIAASAARVTLYASSQDAALRAAQRIAGYPRAGEGGPGVVVVPGIDTVDASSVPTSILGVGHSYYADNTTILSDLFALIRGRRPDERFGLQPVSGAAGRYWRFRPAAR